MPINLIQGASKPIRLHLIGSVTKNKVDLTGVTFIEMCLPPATPPASVDLYYQTQKADVDGLTATLINIADTSEIQEGMVASGTGIPANTTVLKTPLSTSNPTAEGAVLLSQVTTAPATQTPVLFQNIFIASPPADGVITGMTEPQHTKLVKAALNQTIEVTYITPDGETHKAQLTGVLNVTKSICA